MVVPWRIWQFVRIKSLRVGDVKMKDLGPDHNPISSIPDPDPGSDDFLSLDPALG